MNLTWIGSPNFEEGRAGQQVKMIVAHYINGDISASDATFQNTIRDTSAHYAIQDNQTHQYVDENNTAYHAGNLLVNYESIGIEHSATLQRPPSDETYQTSIQLITMLCKRYGLSEEDIYPHSQFVATQCPGTVDVNRIKQGVANNLKEAPMLNQGDVVNIYRVTDGRDPVPDEIKAYSGQEFKKIVYEQVLPKFQQLASTRTQGDKLSKAKDLAKQIQGL